MAADKYDVIVIGSGFSGSLLAYVLASCGQSVALIDSRSHPRFAIGESSTPIADLLMERIVKDFGLGLKNASKGSAESASVNSHPLASLSRYGNWKRDYPQITCGMKRGFSYFRHYANQPFSDDSLHSSSMLVTASRNDALADTHWFRSDVDHHFFQSARDAGAESMLGQVIDIRRSWSQNGKWVLSFVPADSESNVEVRGGFIVDASGRGGVLGKWLDLGDQTKQLLTSSKTTYGHFRNVGSWQTWLESNRFFVQDYPFNADDAAQHHILEDGWLWMLRFENGITSVGWTRPADSASNINAEAGNLQSLNLAAYGSLKDLFDAAELVAPASGLTTSGRLQHLCKRLVGPDFALMPTAAVTIDPLHSSGIAHGLAGVYRLSKMILESKAYSQHREDMLKDYEQVVLREAMLLDQLVAGCYDAAGNFELFKAHAMFYFIAAIDCEESIAAGDEPSALWKSSDPQFCRLVSQSRNRVSSQARATADSASNAEVNARQIAEHWAWTRASLAPWNRAGLIEPEARNMYRYTAAPK